MTDAHKEGSGNGVEVGHPKTPQVPLKAGLPPLPAKMSHLRVDGRGYPVPYHVLWRAGRPVFNAPNPPKLFKALRHKLCWICGLQLGQHVSFMGEPISLVTHIMSEPPCHKECAEFASLGLCQPNATVMVWSTARYRPFKVKNIIYFQLGPPDSVDWFIHGRKATRDEVVPVIDAGMPELYEDAQKKGPEQHLLLQQLYQEAMRWVPTLALSVAAANA